MKKILGLLIAAITILACSSPERQAVENFDPAQAVVYEMNVRQLTPEGSFDAAAEKLITLKELGVDIVWLMPVYPIGELGRKGTLGS